MSLDEDLRVTLTREAERRTAPPPDIVGMISGGRVRRRRRTVVRTAATAALAVIVGFAAYGVTQADRLADPAPVPGPADRTTPDPRLLGPQPGRPYRMVVGSHRDGTMIEAEVTVDSNRWGTGDFAKLPDATVSSWVGLGVYEPLMLAAGNGCREDERRVTVAATPEAVAGQLSRLPRSEVLLTPTRTEAFGREALHLRMRIDPDCPTYYRLADTARGERGITYPGQDDVVVDVVIDFWVVDVDGTPVVVDQWRNVDAPAGIVDRVRRVRESITIVD